MTQTLAPAGEDLVTAIRQHYREAEERGEKPPGRPTLATLTGATDHQIRKALAALEEELAAVTASEPPAPPEEDTSAGQSPTSAPPAPPEEDTSAGQSPTSAPPAGGMFVAWAGFVFGSVVSIAANVLAARIPPGDAGANWSPSLVAQLGAAVWPVALLIAVEVLSRVQWPAGGLWRFARFGGVGLVAAGSAVISYGHIRDVLTTWGYSGLGAGVGPLVIDGLMVVSGFALLAKGSSK
ncbi:hypothetical protein MUY14_26295 [Amycolatopsis sp. FBCC-B4732]|uniref:hypothetical protein n=1 Tax=Amycolatopsis sp. FBCC-B4732 TaxID=3079339 RepID=UPI001FF2A8AC|nr:hypothetical protein [Amycolatopsis sp. FBCC-B4732]UOX85302.1 hypothetical protein MUY14_26295 [Amycolatopsis sp. FBCC-B4732]